MSAQRACYRGRAGLIAFAHPPPATQPAPTLLPACPCPAEKTWNKKMLMTGDATEACLEVSLHVSRAAGVEGALPVHASLSWLGRLRQNKKRVGRFNRLVRTCRGPRCNDRVLVLVRSATRTLGVTLPAVEHSRVPSREGTYTPQGTAAASLAAGVTEMTSRVETGVDSRRGRWSSPSLGVPKLHSDRFAHSYSILVFVRRFQILGVSDFCWEGVCGWLGWQFWDGGDR